MTDMNENAKNDWLDLVKRHRKRQKGLPALSSLKTNAGNVELGLHMFNTLSSPDGGVSVDPVNGNVSAAGEGACTECGGMGESFDKRYDNLDDCFDMSTRTLI